MQLKDVHVGMVSCQLYTQTRRHQTPRNPPGKREKEEGGRGGEEGKRRGEGAGGRGRRGEEWEVRSTQYPVGSLHYCDTSCPSALLVPKENKQKRLS